MFFNLVNNNRGQALIESVTTLPTLIILATMGLSLPYFILTNYLNDHWVSQASLCLAQEKTKPHCEDQLTRRLSLIPFQKVSHLSFLRHKNIIQVKLQTRSLRRMNYKSQLRLPLKSQDFQRF